MKSMAIRLDDDLHAQLTLVATLEGQNVTDIIRASILTYIEERKALLSSKADEALAEIEREAEARRQAIASLFGSTGPVTLEQGAPETSGKPTDEGEPPDGPSEGPKSGRGRRGGATG